MVAEECELMIVASTDPGGVAECTRLTRGSALATG
jgi:hypothetical protein